MQIMNHSFVSRLVSDKYQRAVSGLVMARTALWSLDIREHEFKDTEALHRALCETSSLVSLNSLSLENNENANISQTLQRDRSLLLPSSRALAAPHASGVCCFPPQAHRLPGLFFWKQEA